MSANVDQVLSSNHVLDGGTKLKVPGVKVLSLLDVLHSESVSLQDSVGHGDDLSARETDGGALLNDASSNSTIIGRVRQASDIDELFHFCGHSFDPSSTKQSVYVIEIL